MEAYNQQSEGIPIGFFLLPFFLTKIFLLFFYINNLSDMSNRLWLTGNTYKIKLHTQKKEEEKKNKLKELKSL